MAYFPEPAFWSEDPSLLTSSEDEESVSRYRITHQHAKTKRQGKTKRSKGQERKEQWTWDDVLDGKGCYTWEEILAGRDRLPWEQVEALRRAEATWERNRSYEGTRLARKPKKPPGVTSAGTSHQV
ncbi:uncharacterized protein ACWYII_021341 [Salvelinus alpinus]